MTRPGSSQDGVVFTQNVTVIGGGRVNAVQHGDQYNYIYRGAPPYRVEFFAVSEPTRPDLLGCVPSRLLTARHRVVPYVARPELATLECWRDEATPGLTVRLVHAEGGSGKTRLAYEFAQRSAAAGWAVAQARHRSEVASAGGGDESLTVRAPGLVMIVDYAERWPLEDLITLVRQHRDAARDRLRILLLSRPTGTWWQGLVHQFAKLDILDVQALRLEALPDTPGARAGMYCLARDRFAEVLALEGPGMPTVPGHLDEPAFALMLTVHMRALVDVDAAARGKLPPTGSGQAALSSYLLDREHDYWRSSHDRGRGPVATAELAMGRIVYVATLTRSLPPADGAIALNRTGIAVTAARSGQLIADHARCYPPVEPGLVLEPFYPDRLGEDYLALSVPGHESDFGYHATDPWTTTAAQRLLAPDGTRAEPADFTRQALSVLIEAAHRWPHLTVSHLAPLLREHPTLALVAGGNALIRLADLESLDLAVLEAIEPHLPRHKHVELELGAVAVAERLTRHRLATTDDPAVCASLHNELGTRYGIAGLNHQAVASLQEAVDLYRRLAGQDATHRPALARVLNDLGLRLAAVGRRQEAVELCEQAVDMYRALAAQDPAAHLASLPGTLHTLACRRTEAGRHHEAVELCQQAVDLYQRLAKQDPPAVTAPDFAEALHDLSSALVGAGRSRDALQPIEQAVWAYRRMAEQDPAVFLPNFAMALHGLGGVFLRLGRAQEAVQAAGQAVTIRRQLAETNRAAHLPDLAVSLTGLGLSFAGMQRWQEAAEPAGEAVDLYRRLVERNPGAYLPHFAAAVTSFGHVLSNAGRVREALEQARQGVGLYRRLVEQNPAAHLPDLAVALDGLRIALKMAGHVQEALEPSEQAVAVCQRLADQEPTTVLPLANALCGLGSTLALTDRRQEAVEPLQKAVSLYRQLGQTHLPGLAEALTALGFILSGMQRWHEAVEYIEQAAGLYRKLAEQNPSPYLSMFANALKMRDIIRGGAGLGAAKQCVLDEPCIGS